MSFSVNFPNINPTLMIDCVNRSSLDSRVTFTRASTATFVNSSGVITTAAANVPRFTHDPATLQPQGLLIEEQRTNGIRNNTMQGAVAGTPGTPPTNWAVSAAAGLTTDVVGTGTANGITWIDLRISGTTNATSYVLRTAGTGDTAASAGQVWTSSTWAAIAAGSTTNITSINLQVRDNIAASSQAMSLTSALTRYFHTATLSVGTTGVATTFSITFSSGAAIDITLRIGLPQLELGAFATSVIPTTTTALTRNADVASMTGTNFSSWYNASEGTLYVEAQLQGVEGLAPAALVSIDDVTTNNRIILRRSLVAGTANFRFVSSAGSIDANLLSGSNTGLNKMIAAFKAGDQQSANNGTLFTGITPVASLPIVTRLAIGDGTGSTPASGTIRRIAYYPTRLSNAQLQALTG
jgi:hypothetical protein